MRIEDLIDSSATTERWTESEFRWRSYEFRTEFSCPGLL